MPLIASCDSTNDYNAVLGKRKRQQSEVDVAETLAASKPKPIHGHRTRRLIVVSDGDHPILQTQALCALTEANLLRFTRLTMPSSSAPIKIPSRRKSRSPVKSAGNDLARLQAYNIFQSDSQLEELPRELNNLVKGFSVRDAASGPPSARAKKIAMVREAAVKKQEDDGIRMIAHLLFLYPFVYGDNDEHQFVDVANNHNLVRGFLPEPPSKWAQELGRLENPRPDLCFGYMTTSIAHLLPGAKPLLSLTDELVARAKRINVSEHVSHPFLTVQMKSAIGSQNLATAELQALRDGAAICRANHALFDLAGVTPADLTSTCHFSATSDIVTARLYVHFQQPGDDPHFPIYRTKTIYECRLGNTEEVAGWRTRINNIYAWAIGPRAISIREALRVLATSESDALGPGCDDDFSTTTASESSHTMTISTTGSTRKRATPRTFMATPESERSQWAPTLFNTFQRSDSPLEAPSHTENVPGRVKKGTSEDVAQKRLKM